MQMKKSGLAYEDAAQMASVTGWSCKTCHRFYGDNEHLARWCCASSVPCQCGGRISGPYKVCDDCRQKNRRRIYDAMPSADWSGVGPLAIFDSDIFFFSVEDLEDHLAETGGKIEDVQLVLCEPTRPHRWEAQDEWSDYLGEYELDGCEQIEDAVYQWAQTHLPTMWRPIGVKPTRDSLGLLSHA